MYSMSDKYSTNTLYTTANISRFYKSLSVADLEKICPDNILSSTYIRYIIIEESIIYI